MRRAVTEREGAGIRAKSLPLDTYAGMNGAEKAYAQQLDFRQKAGEILFWRYESVTLKLADRTTYTPDFLEVDREGYITFAEVKGFLRDDAAAKFKIAAKLYPWARFKMIRLKRGAWEVIYDVRGGQP